MFEIIQQRVRLAKTSPSKSLQQASSILLLLPLLLLAALPILHMPPPLVEGGTMGGGGLLQVLKQRGVAPGVHVDTNSEGIVEGWAPQEHELLYTSSVHMAPWSAGDRCGARAAGRSRCTRHLAIGHILV